ncbi:MAG: hypothetical protein KF857_06660 [Fimbriimonadaceae bacterium]|nr:hypothetical protein [Fimbriimonadaceae bacterium]
MKHTLIVSVAALAMLAVSGTVCAQAAGPGGPGQPGQFGPGGPRRPMMGMGLNGPMLLKHPNVQKELALTDEQKKQIDELVPRGPRGGFGGPPPQGGFDGGPGGPPPQGGFDGGPGGPPPQGGFGGGQGGPPPQDGGRGPMPRQDMEKKIAEILTSKQLARYKEIQLQATAPMSMLRPEVAEKLGLSDDQRTKLDEIVRDGMPKPRQPGGFGGGQGGPGGPPPEGGFGGPGRQRRPGGPPMMVDPTKRAELVKRALDVLTDSQKTKWKAMTGKVIDLTPPKRDDAGRP